MDRIADVLTVTFSVRPEWNPDVPLHWSNVHLETILSRQFAQLPGMTAVVEKMGDIVRRELALSHIFQFRQKLNQVSPRNGYLIDDETRAAMLGNITLATEDNEAEAFHTAPSLPPQPVNIQPNPSPPSSSPLPSTSRLPSTPGDGRMPRATYVRVTMFEQRIEDANTPARAGDRRAWAGNTPPSRARPLRSAPAPPTTPPRSTSSQQVSTTTATPLSSLTPPQLVLSSLTSRLPQTPSTPRHHAIASSSTISAIPQMPSSLHLQTEPLSSQPTPLHTLTVNAVDVESDDDDAVIAMGPRASWMSTPTGSPQLVHLEINNPAPPAPPPPAYYTIPLHIDGFDFPPRVARLLEALDSGHRALCKISSARDYDIESWAGQFAEAGLSEEDAASLQNLFVEALTTEQRQILLAPAPHSPTTSVSTESSIAFST